MSASAPEIALLESHLKALRLPAVRRDFQRVAAEATSSGWTYEAYLRILLDTEVTERAQRAIELGIRSARFPVIKTLAGLDYGLLSGIAPAQLADLATGAFIDAAVDVVIAGPVGTGKTHAAIGLGIAAAEQRYSVLFTRAADLVRDLTEARDQLALGRVVRRLERVQLLIIDELGFVPFDRTGAELLFNLLSDRHGKASTLVTSNLAFGEWVQVFGSEKMTVALLDRLCYNAVILLTKGPSYRTRGRLGAPALVVSVDRAPSAAGPSAAAIAATGRTSTVAVDSTEDATANAASAADVTNAAIVTNVTATAVADDAGVDADATK